MLRRHRVTCLSRLRANDVAPRPLPVAVLVTHHGLYRLNLTLPQRLINQEFALPALTLLETKAFAAAVHTPGTSRPRPLDAPAVPTRGGARSTPGRDLGDTRGQLL